MVRRSDRAMKRNTEVGRFTKPVSKRAKGAVERQPQDEGCQEGDDDQLARREPGHAMAEDVLMFNS